MDDGLNARLHVGHVQGSHQELYHPGHGGVRVRVGALACSEPDYGYGHRVYAGDDPAPFDRYHDQRTGAHPRRSEEHTSELQSLMRISYAVFCLKKTIHKTYNKQKYEIKEINVR